MNLIPSRQLRGSRWVAWLLAVAAVAVVTALYYHQNAFLEGFEARTYDLRFKSLRGPIPASSDIAIIAIDERSIAALGRFPWSRQAYVRLLDKLQAVQPRGVLFDAFFPEVESAAADQALADAIRRAGNVVLATSYDLDRQLQPRSRLGSLPALEQAARGVAHINLIPEEDGVNRRNLLLVQEGGRQVPSLGLAGAMLALGVEHPVAEPFAVHLGERLVPVGGDGELWINYPGRSGAYTRLSFIDVLQGQVDPAQLRGKIIFVGATALGIYDMRVTPFDANTPGVEVHAAVADDILSERYIHRTGLQSLFDLLMISVVGLLCFWLTARLRLQAAILASMTVIAIYIVLCYALFVQGQWVSMVYPPLAGLTALLTGGAWRYTVLDRKTRALRAMFSSYLSNKLVTQLEKNPAAVRIGGDTRDVTVMFTDIKGFTAFSERHRPQEVVQRLNEYLAAMVEVILDHDGTVDKFMGDGILAYWGAPLAQPDHAHRAVACAQAMRRRMRDLTAEWRERGDEPLEMRGGLQSGDVVAGNIGSRGLKMEYTVIGDTVNQASRLEGMAKYFGVDFVVGDATYLKTCDSFRYRRLDRVRVVGKDIPVAIHELRGDVGPEEFPEAEFAGALDHFRQQHWDEAQAAFELILAQCPEDAPSRIYLERCKHYRLAPAGADWDGVFNRQEK